MLKELIQFTSHALKDEAFASLNLEPKDGLHVVFHTEERNGHPTLSGGTSAVYFSSKKKGQAIDPNLLNCAKWAPAAWMVNTNKCLDLPIKAIHSASPFCVAVKRENLAGGKKYIENAKKEKSQVYERVDAYFEKALELLDDEKEKELALAFRGELNGMDKMQYRLELIEKFGELKDGEYVIFYLDLPLEIYEKANQKYLKEKLFNTSDYNVADEKDGELLYGTSNWKNGFPSKKPFLLHQSASFDIAGRISSKEALLLYEFSGLARRKLFPHPLPLFVMKDELADAAISLYKKDLSEGREAVRGYLEIVEILWKSHKNDLGNYYLLNTVAGDIKDFDFVSKFEFYLNKDENALVIEDLFGIGQANRVATVKGFQNQVMPSLFNNALVVKRKDKPPMLRYFSDIDPQYCKTHNAFLLAVKYRKAFYDFIYKSKRQGVTAEAIKELLLTGILDDIRLDKYENKKHSESFNIRTKLNLLFSLLPYFSKPNNPRFMANHITGLRDHLDAVAKGEAQIETDDQFAFAAGQVIARIFRVSETGDQSYKYLEPFLNQTNATGLKKAISQFFKRYKHGVYARRFGQAMSQILAYEVDGNYKDLEPVLLSGVFSNNQLYAEKTDEQPETTT